MCNYAWLCRAFTTESKLLAPRGYNKASSMNSGPTRKRIPCSYFITPSPPEHAMLLSPGTKWRHDCRQQVHQADEGMMGAGYRSRPLCRLSYIVRGISLDRHASPRLTSIFSRQGRKRCVEICRPLNNSAEVRRKGTRVFRDSHRDLRGKPCRVPVPPVSPSPLPNSLLDRLGQRPGQMRRFPSKTRDGARSHTHSADAPVGAHIFQFWHPYQRI
jgi:hypothetical protein